MTDFADDLELPIKKVKIDGPAVRALADRKESNNHPRVTTAQLSDAYAKVRPSLLKGLAELGSAKVR
jgi:hypothetical protein